MRRGRRKRRRRKRKMGEEEEEEKEEDEEKEEEEKDSNGRSSSSTSIASKPFWPRSLRPSSPALPDPDPQDVLPGGRGPAGRPRRGPSGLCVCCGGSGPPSILAATVTSTRTMRSMGPAWPVAGPWWFALKNQFPCPSKNLWTRLIFQPHLRR